MVPPNGRRQPLDVDVDPLVVAGGVRELVDPVLVDLQPLAGAEVLADRGGDLVDVLSERMRPNLHPRVASRPA